MNLYIGEKTVIPFKSIVAILNTEKIAKYNNDFFETMKYSKKLIMLCEKNKAKTCIITTNSLYMSSISSHTINKRIKNFKKIYL